MLDIGNIKIESVNRTLMMGRLIGDNEVVSMNRFSSGMSRDRVSAYLISQCNRTITKNFNSTVIQVVDTAVESRCEQVIERAKLKDLGIDETVMWKSNKVLSYGALIAIIYRLRIEGYILSDLANIDEYRGSGFISIEDIHVRGNEIIKISTCSALEDVVHEVSRKGKEKVLDKHIVSGVIIRTFGGISEDTMYSVVTRAMRSVYSVIEEYYVTSEDRDCYIIIEADELTCVYGRRHIMLVYSNSGVDTQALKGKLASLLSEQSTEYVLRSTQELVML